MKKTQVVARWLALPILFVCAMMVLVNCSNKENFASKNTTQFFVQSFNPPFLDVLWMVDDRTDLSYYASTRNQVISQAQTFFTRLDAMTTSDYRMAIIDGDSSQSGTLEPHGTGTILTKGLASIATRVSAFTSIIGEIIDLNTASQMTGLENARLALNSTFVPRTGVPLVMVFITDSDDHSQLPASAGTADPISYYSQAYLAAVGNNPKLLQVFSVNYVQGGTHCASQANIDQPSDYNNNFDKVSTALSGQNVDLCGSWGNAISLNGLKLTTPQTTFALSSTPQISTLTVSIFDTQGNSYDTVTAYPYTYSASTNSIVFSPNPPPDGTTIQVDYLPQ